MEKNVSKSERPPPYASHYDSANQLPMVNATLHVRGNVEFENQKLEEEEGEGERAVGFHCEEAEEHTSDKPLRVKGETPAMQKQAEPLRSKEGKKKSTDPTMTDPYYYAKQALRELEERGRGEEAAGEQPLQDQDIADSLLSFHQDMKITEELLAKEAQAMREIIEKEEWKSCQRSRAHSSSPDGEYKRVSGTLLLEGVPQREQRWRRGDNLRERPTSAIFMQRAEEDMQDKDKRQCPILIRGRQGQYVPWARQDLEGLVARLPDIHEGAGKWIRLLEKETMGKILAIGDVKALLARCVGGAKTNEIFEAAGLQPAIGRTDMDATPLDIFRPLIWQTLRRSYTTQMDPKLLKGEQIGEAENPTTYIQRQLRRWKQELERDPEKDPVITTLFRTAIVEAMPPAVKTRLEDVVGLNSKSPKEFCDHVAHAVEQHRKNEQKLKKSRKRAS
ncbi:uncharacterized protein LOC125267784 [Megalobrama amblycephala]|uniref:uncharacterized protein LOC125267784 n=1 Tax=Megalobrama amblycephala TaxID=75352 RepID=UPI002013D835|nr:uncharacterized protein LOC125267784 [Megalobrama amblycephala]